jgi:hypothetical protein
MKKFLFLPLLLITFLSFSQEASEIIGKPVKIGNLIVAENDFSESMDCKESIKACAELGKGWRLPTNSELKILYANRKKIGNFSENNYWSSTKVPNAFFFVDFSNGKVGKISVNEEFNESPSVRAVKFKN